MTCAPRPVAWMSRIRPPVPVVAPGNGATPGQCTSNSSVDATITCSCHSNNNQSSHFGNLVWPAESQKKWFPFVAVVIAQLRVTSDEFDSWVKCHSTLSTNIRYVNGNVGRVRVQEPTVTRMQLCEVWYRPTEARDYSVNYSTWLGGVTVRTLDSWSKGHGFNSQSGPYRVVTTWMGEVNHLGI